MDVPSYQFLVFALSGAVAFNIWSNKLFRRLVLLVINITFFCCFLPGLQSGVPYVGFLALGYGFVNLLIVRPSRSLFLATLSLTILLFFWIKRYLFVPSSILIPFSYTTIGLSYVFFRVLHLLIDAGEGSLTEGLSPLSFVNYTLNFTSLVSGPIQLYPDYQRSAAESRSSLDLLALGFAAERIILGYFKVAIVSRLLHTFQAELISDVVLQKGLFDKAVYTALIGGIYPVFLYANFSGYTDFVIGVARLFRLRLPENFNRPFLSENFIGLWGRWHITLSNWLKTYVYTPLLMEMMRRVPSKSIEAYAGVAAYFVTFFLVGAWHGQTSEFIFFGVLQGGGVAANKLFQILITKGLTRKGYRALSARPLYIGLCMGLTFTWFAFTLLWFWSSWEQLAMLLKTIGLAAVICGWLIVLLISGMVLFAYRAVSLRSEKIHDTEYKQFEIPTSRYRRTVTATMMVVVIAASSFLFSGPAADIVYKNF